MTDILDKADSFQVVLKRDETLPDSDSPKADSPLAECTHSRKRRTHNPSLVISSVPAFNFINRDLSRSVHVGSA